ncbi:MAG: hypothetical protein E7186_00760 [Erysipelotrichaceae bacterium]|nr:hypothetical protein [Erysipelotrichaceae bacterium]
MVLFSLGCLDSLFHRLLAALLWAVFLKGIVNREKRKLICIVMVLFLILSARFPSKISKGRVVEIRNSYLIVSDGYSRVLLYGSDGNIGLDDLLEFEAQLDRVSGYDNFETSTFPQWAKGQGIYYRGNLKEYHIVKKGVSLRRIIMDHCRLYDNKWALMLLFNTGLDSDSDFRYFITHAGFHVSFLVAMIRRIYERWFYRHDARNLTFATVVLLGAVFGFPYSWFRAAAGLLAGLLWENRRDQVGFQACLLMLARPYYIRTVSFVIPLGLSFLNLFQKEGNGTFVRYVFLMLCQLRFYGYCDLRQMGLFSLLSRAVSGLYVLAVLVSFRPFSLDFNDLTVNYAGWLDKIPSVYLNGRCDIILSVTVMALLLNYLNSGKRTVILYIVGLLLMNNCQAVLSPCYRITWLDIGQGDCALVSFPFSSHGLLIDTGGNLYKDVSHDITVPYLRSRGLKSVDVVLSHQDLDHAGGLHSLNREFNVGRVWFDKQEKIRVRDLEITDPLYDREYEDANDNSQISYFRIEGNGFLFLGDISSSVEEDLVSDFSELDVDVIKIAHHGSATATSDKLLAAYRPRFAVISAGRNNRFNHPDPEVLNRLDSYLVTVFCTKTDHAIEFRIYRWFTFYRTASGRYGVFLNSH